MTSLDRAIDLIIASLRSGGALYACGNGGSDAHAGHLVAELIGRFAYDRPPLRAVHLSSGGPVGSCIANDYGWEQVFARQVWALCRPDDVLVCFTTSGRSRNVLSALGKGRRGQTVAFTGPSGLVSPWEPAPGAGPYVPGYSSSWEFTTRTYNALQKAGVLCVEQLAACDLNAVGLGPKSRAEVDYFMAKWGIRSGEALPGPVEVHSTATTTPAIQEQHQAWVHEIARRVEEAMCPR